LRHNTLWYPTRRRCHGGCRIRALSVSSGQYILMYLQCVLGAIQLLTVTYSACVGSGFLFLLCLASCVDVATWQCSVVCWVFCLSDVVSATAGGWGAVLVCAAVHSLLVYIFCIMWALLLLYLYMGNAMSHGVFFVISEFRVLHGSKVCCACCRTCWSLDGYACHAAERQCSVWLWSRSSARVDVCKGSAHSYCT
jgi:hypothetical protein